MGTRHLVCAVLNNEFKIAQYGQFDGYPDCAGRGTCEFIQQNDMDKFKSCVSELTEETNLREILNQYGNDGWMNLEQDRKFQENYPQYHRCTSAKIFDLVLNHGVKKVSLYVEFGKDSLFCEYAYVLNLDNNTLEFYKGFQKEPHNSGRWAGQEGEEDYYPIKLIETIPFDEIKAKGYEALAERLPKDDEE